MARISSAVCLLLLVALSTVYEVQGTFLLRHFLRKIPRRSRGFRPFACKGMLKFVNLLEFKSPQKPEYKNLFGNLRSYVGAISSGSNVDLKGKAEGVQSALSTLGSSTGSSVDTSKVMNVLMNMGKTLTSQTSSSSTEMTSGQRKELLTSLVQWARVISQVVVSTASKSGSSIDINSLGIDGIDTNVATGGSTSTSATGTSNTQTGTSTSATGTSNTQTGASTTGNYMNGITGTGTGTVPVPSTGTVPVPSTGTVPVPSTGTSTSTSGTSNTQTGTSTSGNYMNDITGMGTVPVPGTGIDPGFGMAGGPASSTEGGTSFGRTFSGKTGSTNYAGSVNYQSGQKTSKQTTTGTSGTPGNTVSPGSF